MLMLPQCSNVVTFTWHTEQNHSELALITEFPN